MRVLTNFAVVAIMLIGAISLQAWLALQAQIDYLSAPLIVEQDHFSGNWIADGQAGFQVANFTCDKRVCIERRKDIFRTGFRLHRKLVVTTSYRIVYNSRTRLEASADGVRIVVDRLSKNIRRTQIGHADQQLIDRGQLRSSVNAGLAKSRFTKFAYGFLHLHTFSTR